MHIGTVALISLGAVNVRAEIVVIRRGAGIASIRNEEINPRFRDE